MLEKKLPSVCIKAGGSWTAFSKESPQTETVQCKLEYLPVVQLTPHDNIVKWYVG